MSSYKTTNLHYLRISANSVLPLYLYLDERHVSWMSDKVLQYVLADLRPLIIPKLRAEADVHIGPGGPSNAKKGTVEVHRGDSYQFAFFFRKTEPHSILIKTRNYVTLPIPPAPPPLVPETSPKKLGKRTRKDTGSQDNVLRKKSKTKSKGKGKAKALEDSDVINLDDSDEAETEPVQPRRSQRSRKKIAKEYQGMEDTEEDDSPGQPDDDDFEMEDEFVEPPKTRDAGVAVKDEEEEPSLPQPVQPPAVGMDVEEEERKPKPGLQLRYNGFNIFGRCLCVVVEPWPPIRATPAPPEVARTMFRAVSSAPSVLAEAGVREQTPLFLPELDDRGRSVTPAPQNWRPPVPLFNDPPPEEDEEDEGELMLFSQAIQSRPDSRTEVDDDDEFDGTVLFGDADEIKELQ